ncbi:MAG TPA: hypothetical protein PLE73_07370 [Spirochaetota bacterium]|nr:hypothetical protein [Spirochaetota bacterium]
MHTDRRYKEIAGILVLMLSLIIALSLAGVLGSCLSPLALGISG